MKRTEINYIKTKDGRIKITGFSNVATTREIEEEMGEEVARIYKDYEPCYGLDNDTIRIFKKEPPFNIEVRKGYIVSKQTFKMVIKSMKEAGNRLMEIKKGVAEYTEETIII